MKKFKYQKTVTFVVIGSLLGSMPAQAGLFGGSKPKKLQDMSEMEAAYHFWKQPKSAGKDVSEIIADVASNVKFDQAGAAVGTNIREGFDPLLENLNPGEYGSNFREYLSGGMSSFFKEFSETTREFITDNASAGAEAYSELGNTFVKYGILTTLSTTGLYYGIIITYNLANLAIGRVNRPNLAIEKSSGGFSYFFRDPSKISDLVFTQTTETAVTDYYKQLKTAQRFRGNLPSLLLTGPSGTGKSALAKRIAKEGNFNYVFISGASLSQYEESVALQELANLMIWAKRTGNVMIFVDEAEALFPDRASVQLQTSEKTRKILAYWQSLTSELSRQFTIVAATNRPDLLDKAILPRFSTHIELPVPDLAARIRLLNKYFKQELTSDPKIHCEGDFLGSHFIEKIATHSEGFSGADIEAMAVALKMLAYSTPQFSLSTEQADGILQRFIDKYKKRLEK